MDSFTHESSAIYRVKAPEPGFGEECPDLEQRLFRTSTIQKPGGLRAAKSLTRHGCCFTSVNAIDSRQLVNGRIHKSTRLLWRSRRSEKVR
jgi:hypothetical protein